MIAFISSGPLIPEFPQFFKGAVGGAQAEETKAFNRAAGDKALLWRSSEASKASSVRSQLITGAAVSKEKY